MFRWLLYYMCRLLDWKKWSIPGMAWWYVPSAWVVFLHTGQEYTMSAESWCILMDKLGGTFFYYQDVPSVPSLWGVIRTYWTHVRTVQKYSCNTVLMNKFVGIFCCSQDVPTVPMNMASGYAPSARAVIRTHWTQCHVHSVQRDAKHVY